MIHGFVTITFPNGTVYSVRKSQSGILFDRNGMEVDLELAEALLQFKAWKLAIMSSTRPC